MSFRLNSVMTSLWAERGDICCAIPLLRPFYCSNQWRIWGGHCVWAPLSNRPLFLWWYFWLFY